MRSWMVALAAVGLVAALVPMARTSHGAPGPEVPIAQVTGATSAPVTPPVPVEHAIPVNTTVSLAGLDLARIGLGDDGATAPLDHERTARLTVDPVLQEAAWNAMAARHVPEASIVLLDPQTGELLVYASHIEGAPMRDLIVQARAPAASVFKIVTASALVDDAALGPDTRQCYSGGEERIVASDLVDNPARDRWCVTLAGAMGRSVNAVFARLASKLLDGPKLEHAAKSFSFGQAIPFDVAVEASTIHVPDDTLGFARTAAGFWNTTLSPLHAAWMSATVQRGGESVRPVIVREVVGKEGVVAEAPVSRAAHAEVISASTAEALTTMMEHTVSEGTSYRAFHDAARRPFLPGITVAGKTGTLTDEHAQRFYTWFTGSPRPIQCRAFDPSS